MTKLDEAAESDARYLAMKAHDARFDGRFFTGVTSTGVYCRPVCRVRTPKRENCRFFQLAAQAEQAGFRPCLRCRPELAPQHQAWSIQDASATLARHAARLLDDPNSWSDEPASVERLAARLGISDRHVRRIFEQHFGVTPVQYLQTRRLLNAKQLLTDTDLAMTRVAFVSGFASVRRFNACFLQHYGLSPSRLRSNVGARPEGGAPIRLGYRPPYDVAAMLEFFAKRQIAGVESVATDTGARSIARTVRLHSGKTEHRGWLLASFDETRNQLLLRCGDSLREILPLLIPRLRAMLDLDADPQAINAALQKDFPDGDGLRVPGTMDGLELAVRAVLGQQITVAAARTLAQRLVEKFGDPIETPVPGLTRLFPSARALANLDGDALGSLGIVRQRQAAILALARACAEGRLHLHAGADLDATVAALKAVPGIGDWTAQYIAMRALRWPDAFPSGDVALQKALGVQKGRLAAQAADQASQAWRPWRAYAVIRAWNRLSPPTSTVAAGPAKQKEKS